MFNISINATVNLRTFYDQSQQNCSMNFKMHTFPPYDEKFENKTLYMYVPDWDGDLTSCKRQDVIEHLKKDFPSTNLGLLTLNFYFTESFTKMITDEYESVLVYSPFDYLHDYGKSHEQLLFSDFHRELRDMYNLNTYPVGEMLESKYVSTVY
mmetsp:Transcript_8498/g.13044  ORF Transcript_8498/g.13044 Transcript_8498/m.13044 type:complete len:153 (+) Transcript_8498:878-1336(+)